MIGLPPWAVLHVAHSDGITRGVKYSSHRNLRWLVNQTLGLDQIVWIPWTRNSDETTSVAADDDPIAALLPGKPYPLRNGSICGKHPQGKPAEWGIQANSDENKRGLK